MTIIQSETDHELTRNYTQNYARRKLIHHIRVVPK